MRLVVETERADGLAKHRAFIRILNAGDEVDLIANWRFEGEKGDLEEYLLTQLDFHCSPIGVTSPGSTARSGSVRRSPQPTYLLKSGNHLDLMISGETNELFGGRLRRFYPYGGQYWVRASLRLKTTDGKSIELLSNEQLVPFHDQNGMPIPPNASILEIDPESRMVTLDIGAFHGITTEFDFKAWVRERSDGAKKSPERPKLRTASIDLVEVGLYRSKGIVQLPSKNFSLPEVGDEATLGVEW